MVHSKEIRIRRALPTLRGARPNQEAVMDAILSARTLTEAELAKVLQAYFRQFVRAARLTQDARTGEPVVRVEFADKPQ